MCPSAAGQGSMRPLFSARAGGLPGPPPAGPAEAGPSGMSGVQSGLEHGSSGGAGALGRKQREVSGLLDPGGSWTRVGKGPWRTR